MQQRLQLKEARVTHGAAEHWNDRVAEAADHPVPCWLQVMTDKNADNASKAADAKSLLKRYGSAYLVTSISFAAVSYAICYALVSQGTSPPFPRTAEHLGNRALSRHHCEMPHDASSPIIAQNCRIAEPNAELQAIILTQFRALSESLPASLPHCTMHRGGRSSSACQGRDHDIGNEREGRDRSHRLRSSQGRVPDPLPPDSSLDASGGQMARKGVS